MSSYECLELSNWRITLAVDGDGNLVVRASHLISDFQGEQTFRADHEPQQDRQRQRLDATTYGDDIIDISGEVPSETRRANEVSPHTRGAETPSDTTAAKKLDGKTTDHHTEALMTLLPEEVLLHIFRFLTPSELFTVQKVCHRFRGVAKDDVIWRSVFDAHFGGPRKAGRTWRQECISAMNRCRRYAKKYQADMLLWGAKHGHVRFVERLITRHKMDINNVKNLNGASPLHLASHNGHLETAALLLRHRAEVNARTTYGRTPLERAAKNGHKAVVDLLLAHKADVNAATDGGETPLLVAASSNHREIVECLLQHGADANAQSAGFTALRIATLQGFTDIVHLLKATSAPLSQSK